MARSKSTTLTEAEVRLMNVLWARGASTVNSSRCAARRSAPAYSTVLTTLRILEDKGYLKHRKDGRAFLYIPRVPREQAQRSAMRLLLSRFFENSAEQLVLNILKHEKLDTAELQRLKQIIAETDIEEAE